jgi:hypothetical protein
MTFLNASPLLIFAFTLLGCEKLPPPAVSPDLTPSATADGRLTAAQVRAASPPQQRTNVTNMSAADEEALKQVKRRFATLYRQKGDSWITEGFNAIWYTEVQQPSFTIVSSPLSDIDKLNGYDYRGKAVIKFVATRDSGIGENLNKWGDWKAGGGETIDVFKQKGVWRFRVTIDPDGNQKDW